MSQFALRYLLKSYIPLNFSTLSFDLGQCMTHAFFHKEQFTTMMNQKILFFTCEVKVQSALLFNRQPHVRVCKFGIVLKCFKHLIYI